MPARTPALGRRRFAALQQARATGRAADERWHQRKDGTRFWGSGMLTALRNEQGQLRGFAKILRDLTERRQAAVERGRLLEQIAFERRRLATVPQQMPAGVVLRLRSLRKFLQGQRILRNWW